MKVYFPYSNSSAGYLNSMMKALQKNSMTTIQADKYISSFRNRVMRKLITNNKYQHNHSIEYNKYFLENIKKEKPNIFFNYSGSGLLPETLRIIKEDLKCKTMCFIGDNPFDPLPKRDKYFAISLRYYDVLFSPEPNWDKLVRNVAPNSKIVRFYGGYEPENFYPVDKSEITEEDIKRFSCDISFTGGSYGISPEGSYRSGILGLLEEYHLKLWGDNKWRWRYKYYPNLEKAHLGTRLSYSELRKLYSITSISLNIPSPMLTKGFQPRVFEIAAAKGFQIVDHTDELYNYYDKDEIVTFKDFYDLKEKIDYYLNHTEAKSYIINKMYSRTVETYSWTNQIKILINEF